MTAEEIQGWMANEELDWLRKVSSTMNSVVEIGCWKGRSTMALLEGCKGPVFAVDHFKGNPDEIDGAHQEAKTSNIYEEFYKNVGHFPNLITMRMESVQAAKYFQYRSIDMVFIDACHLKEHFLVDILSWIPVCRKLICGHDIGSNGIDEALEFLKIKYSIPMEAQGIWSVDLVKEYYEINDGYGHSPNRDN